MSLLLDDALVTRIKRAVVCGGGEFLGIQTAIDIVPSILFNSPTTGNQLSLFLIAEFSHTIYGFDDSKFSEAVHKRIEADIVLSEDRYISMKASTLKSISDMILQANHKIEEIYGRKQCPKSKK